MYVCHITQQVKVIQKEKKNSLACITFAKRITLIEGVPFQVV